MSVFYVSFSLTYLLAIVHLFSCKVDIYLIQNENVVVCTSSVSCIIS